MKNLKLEVYKRGQREAEKTVTVPLATLHFSLELMPENVKASLEADGVDLTRCEELTKEKNLRGTLIEIENPKEKLVISLKGEEKAESHPLFQHGITYSQAVNTVLRGLFVSVLFLNFCF
jgi:hypothetical protein